MTNNNTPYGIAAPAHRLPADLRLGSIQLQVSNLERSLDFYESVLGLRVLEREGGEAVLGARGEEGPLVVLRERSGAAPVPRHGRLGLYHFAILLPSRAELGRFLRRLAELGVRAGASDHFVSEALYLSDPDGLGIEVYADRPRDQWEADGREIRMATVPLNAAELVAEAGEERWGGMLAGTVMGHLHLHVGDLVEAEAFYHRALGLDKVVWSYPGALFLSAGGYHHHLGMNTWAAGAPPAGEDDAGLLEWTIELPETESVAATARSLEEAGYEVEREGEAEFTASDPWGTRLRVRAARTGAHEDGDVVDVEREGGK